MMLTWGLKTRMLLTMGLGRAYIGRSIYFPDEVGGAVSFADKPAGVTIIDKPEVAIDRPVDIELTDKPVEIEFGGNK